MLVAGLCRAALQRGLSVAPFKPQNMSNNAAATAFGGEIGRAQALQARACGVEPHTDMNPVLLKPETDVGAQVIVQGKRFATMKAREYGSRKAELIPKVLESYHRLAAQHDLVVIEGAGSPAEVNLRAGDIANMGFAEAANCPVILVGDIDRGGVIAQLVGTDVILPEADRKRIKAFAINKFRGDTRLFDGGMTAIEEHTGWAPLGIVPWFEQAWKLPAEDVMDIASRKGGPIKVAVPRLNRIANFDDLDPLAAQPDVTVEIIEAGRPLPADADLVLIPGSKSTIADLAHFRAQEWDIDLRAHVRRGGHVLGVCGGYQMLGQEIADPEGIEGPATVVQGLGLLDVKTVMTAQKRVVQSRAVHRDSGADVRGYEIHIGETTGPDCARAWLTLEGGGETEGRGEGAASPDGRVLGCYIHGLFASDAFRHAFMAQIGAPLQNMEYDAQVEDTLDALAAHLERHLDVGRILDLAEDVGT